jgi:phosphocarrier protein HPr
VNPAMPAGKGDDDCAPDADAPAGALVREIPITNQRGLHARAAARFVQTVEKFEAEVSVSRCGETVGGTSIMGILMLSAGIGSSIRVTAKGREAAAALDAIARLCAEKFGEEE